MKKLKKSTLKRLSYPVTPRERAIRLVRLAFIATEGSPTKRTLLVAARYLIAEAEGRDYGAVWIKQEALRAVIKA